MVVSPSWFPCCRTFLQTAGSPKTTWWWAQTFLFKRLIQHFKTTILVSFRNKFTCLSISRTTSKNNLFLRCFAQFFAPYQLCCFSDDLLKLTIKRRPDKSLKTLLMPDDSQTFLCQWPFSSISVTWFKWESEARIRRPQWTPTRRLEVWVFS